jgi:hypothetical protein
LAKRVVCGPPRRRDDAIDVGIGERLIDVKAQ